MFDSLDDAGIVGAIRSSAQAEAAACARRLLAIAELFLRRADADRSSGHEWWWLDTFDAVAAEVSAAQCITPGAAATQLRYAIALTDRLPKVAEVFASGLVSYRVVVAILTRTELIEDDKALAQVDAKLANLIVAWGPMSAKKLERRIDSWVEYFDPGASRRSDAVARARNVLVAPTTVPGFSSISGLLQATDGVALDRRLTQLAKTGAALSCVRRVGMVYPVAGLDVSLPGL
ncbi:MAG: hypothetical protein JWR32_6542 [Mycobacterium sp.]|jgi:hypothetical protein|nr:hypothetical protein [Mycobacterium sp.]